MHLAEVVSGDDWTVPICLACALAHPPQTSAPLRIQIHPNVAHLETVAQSFEQLLRQRNDCLDTSAGITVPRHIFCVMLQHSLSVLTAQANQSDSFHGTNPLRGHQEIISTLITKRLLRCGFKMGPHVMHDPSGNTD